MMRKWLVGLFVFAFSLSFSGMVFAFSNSITCNAYVIQGPTPCKITLHVGDNKLGGLDDYDFVWYTNWEARDYDTAYFYEGSFKATGVEYGNQDYVYSHKFNHAGGTSFYNSYCTGKKVYNMDCALKYNSFLDEISYPTYAVDANVVIYDPETRLYHTATVYFKANQ
jgi:hypothetical protein